MRRPCTSTSAPRPAPVALIIAFAAAVAGIRLLGIFGHGQGSAAAATKHLAKHGHAVGGAGSGGASGLGQLTGLLRKNKLTTERAIQVNLSNETVRLPLFPGKGPNGQKVWYTSCSMPPMRGWRMT